MRKFTVLPLLVALLPFSAMQVGAAQAGELRMTVEKPHFTCEGHGHLLSRVAYIPGAPVQDGFAKTGDAPLPCCDGQIGCAQFLSTNTVIRSAAALRG